MKLIYADIINHSPLHHYMLGICSGKKRNFIICIKMVEIGPQKKLDSCMTLNKTLCY